MDEDLKSQAAELFESLGMDIPTAIRVFFKRGLVEKGLPFDVKTTPSNEVGDPTGLLAAFQAANENAHLNGTAGMSEEEIEAEIKLMHEERRKKNNRRLLSFHQILVIFCSLAHLCIYFVFFPLVMQRSEE